MKPEFAQDDLEQFPDKVALVVDDDPFTRTMVSKMLERLGMKARQAEDGQDAYVKCQNNQPDVVVCDINMKPINGLQFLKRVRTDSSFENNALPVVFLTNSADEKIVGKAQALKANGYIVKPVSPKALEDRLKKVFVKP